MNKHELVSEQEYEECLDHVYTLNEDTPIIKTFERENIAVDPDLVFGLDTRLFQELGKEKYMIDGYVDDDDGHHHSREVDLIQLESGGDKNITREKLEDLLQSCGKEEVYRIKGFVKLEEEGICILNFAFGRWEITPLTRTIQDGERGLRLTVMLARGEGRQWKKEFSRGFAEQNVQIDYHPA
jgi:G3E family GTPase